MSTTVAMVSTELQRHAEQMKQKSSDWMPWNDRETLARLAASLTASLISPDRVINYDESGLAGKDRLRPKLSHISKCP
jgi:hypothetical protein